MEAPGAEHRRDSVQPRGVKMYQVDIENKSLVSLRSTTLSELNLKERFDLQEWIEKMPSILGEEVLIISKELVLPSGTRLDLLAIDKSASLVIIELKRDDSGSEVEWQAIKYASYCSNFLHEDIFKHYADYLRSDVAVAEKNIEQFIEDDISRLNDKQRLILCARQFHSDVASAVLWLREYGLDITCVRLMTFVDDTNRLFIQPETIIPLPEAKDYIQKREKKEKASKEREPFSQFMYVNIGEGDHRNWDDNRRYGFFSAGHGRRWSKQLERLKKGDHIFAYLKGEGYVGFGEVVDSEMPIKDFVVEKEGKPIVELALQAPDAIKYKDDPELTEYVVPIAWQKTFAREEAKTYSGIFANQNIVARMRKGKTVDFLIEAFDIDLGNDGW